MNVVFVTEGRFYKDKQGLFYGDSAFSNNMWNRYLEVFEKVYVLARVKNIDKTESMMKPITQDNVCFIELPYYIGPMAYLKKYISLKRKINKTIREHSKDKFICRVPGILGTLVIKELLKRKLKYAIEVVGDPDDVFSVGTIEHPLRSYFRRKSVHHLQFALSHAGAALYVTTNTLQKKYPANKQAFITFASNVNLPNKESLSSPKVFTSKKNYIVISIGSLDQMYKAPDIVLEAIELLNKRSDEVKYHLIWLGDGKFRGEMIRLSQRLQLEESVSFIGNVNAEQVYDYLKKADLFVLASRTEGLPRVIIEAMGMGLPCIGTNVGGIPELLDEQVLVEKNNVYLLANKIQEILGDKEVYNAQAKRNLKEAGKYKNSLLQAKRVEFYKYIKENL